MEASQAPSDTSVPTPEKVVGAVKSTYKSIIRGSDKSSPNRQRSRKSVRFVGGVGPTRESTRRLPLFATADLRKRSKGRSAVWIAIDGYVYDLAQFLNEHPGGDRVLLEYAGQDATSAFESVGHSSDAKELMKRYRVGRYQRPSAFSNPFVALGSLLVLVAGAYAISLYLKKNQR